MCTFIVTDTFKQFSKSVVDRAEKSICEKNIRKLSFLKILITDIYREKSEYIQELCDNDI